VEVSMPIEMKAGGANREVVLVDVVNPVSSDSGGQEQTDDIGGQRGGDWTLKMGHEVKVSGGITFTEKWEREYRRSVHAKVERKKKGVIDLSLSSTLWQAAPMAQHEDELDLLS